ncbi:MAG TPA: DUF2334 domain-containing protein [Thermoleophilaceae bacterium]|nr:DUF2334 domain-containing protein [Thermoleophilaceae bacterium]
MRSPACLLVTIHGVEPATFEDVAGLRNWLTDRGVERATLLAIPAPRLHPIESAPSGLVDWLRLRRRHGDAVAQHGLRHWSSGRRQGSLGEPRELRTLDPAAARAAVHTGRQILEATGLAPRGFVAPGYAYPSSMRTELRRRYEWWASRAAIHLSHGERIRSSALRPGAMSAWVALGTDLVRLELFSSDYRDSRRLDVLERTLDRVGGAEAISCDELAFRARKPAAMACGIVSA